MAIRRLWQLVLGIVFVVGSSWASAEGPGVAERLNQALAGAKISLAEAVATAQREFPAGTVVDAELQWNGPRPYFEVELLAADKLKELRIDPLTGQMLGVEDQQLDELGVAALAEVKQALAGAKVTAAQVIEAARREAGAGQPLALALEPAGDRPAYGVKLLAGDKLRDLHIDALSGAVLKSVDELLPLALWTFDSAQRGTVPADLRARQTHPSDRPGQWKIAADLTSPSKPNVLTLITSAPNATYNVALFENAAYQDVDLRVQIKANTGKDDQGGGLIWRAKDENNYYICRINPLENNFRVYKVADGKRTQLQSAEFKAETGRWYQVRAVMTGDQITCYVDGKKYLEVKDDTFAAAGLIGLWTKADASSSFDNLVVYAPTGGRTPGPD